MLLQQRVDQCLDVGLADAGGGEVVGPVQEALRLGRVGAYMLDADHLDQPVILGAGLERRFGLLTGTAGRVRTVALDTVVLEQLLATGGLRRIDGAEDVLGPLRRRQLLQRPFDLLEPGNIDRGAEALLRRQWRAFRVHQVDLGTDAQCLADVAGQRLGHRAVVLHPVELPHVPQVGVAHRRRRGLQVGVAQVLAEHRVGDAPERIGAAEAFAGRVEVRQRVVLLDGEEGLERLAQLLVQLARVAAVGQDLAGEAVELERVGPGFRQRADQGGAEAAALQVGEGVHGLATVDAQGVVLAFLAVVQLAGMAGGAADVEQVLAERGGVARGEADRQLVRVAGIEEEMETLEEGGVGEALLRQRLLQVEKPVVAQRPVARALRHRGALRGVVVGLAGRLLPTAVQVAVFVDLLEAGYARLGGLHVVDESPHHGQYQQHDQ